MKSSNYFETQQEAKQQDSDISSFFKAFSVSILLNAIGVRKVKDAALLVIFQAIALLPLKGQKSRHV